jgi:hypothetical protein
VRVKERGPEVEEESDGEAEGIIGGAEGCRVVGIRRRERGKQHKLGILGE